MANKMEILAGQRFGKWTVLQELQGTCKSTGKPIRLFQCQCDCGRLQTHATHTLVHVTRNCPNCRGPSPKRIDLKPGDIYGRLTLVREVTKDRTKSRRWACLCECGNEVIVQISNLRNGHTTSCGCRTIERITLHGLAHAPIYKVWSAIMERVYNSKSKHYKNYGGRGIRVSESWHIFENFFADMGHCPGPKYSLDRIDNDGDYSRENCRWATRKEQNRNKRDNVKIMTDEGVVNLIDYCESNNLHIGSTRSRIARARKWVRRAGFEWSVNEVKGSYQFTPEEVALIISQPTTDVMDLYLRRSL